MHKSSENMAKNYAKCMENRKPPYLLVCEKQQLKPEQML